MRQLQPWLVHHLHQPQHWSVNATALVQPTLLDNVALTCFIVLCPCAQIGTENERMAGGVWTPISLMAMTKREEFGCLATRAS